jgi:hypothetical protein
MAYWRRFANWGTKPMRKFLIVAGLLAGAALFTTGSTTPAKAWVGCACAKLSAPAVCMPGPVECAASGGVCLLPCDYTAPKKMKHHRHHKKAKAKAKKM